MTGMIPRFCPHCNGPLDVNRTIAWGGWTYDEDTRRLLPEPVLAVPDMRLTRPEGAILGALLRAGGRYLSKNGGLYAAACGVRPDVDWPEMKIVDVHICKLRAKLRAYYGENVLIATKWGVGYYAVPRGAALKLPSKIRP